MTPAGVRICLMHNLWSCCAIVLLSALWGCASSPPPQSNESVSDSPDVSVVADGLGTRLDSVVQVHADSGFWGSVLVAVDSAVVLANGYGWADAGGNVPNTPATIFDVGSVTKPITATLVATLLQEGQLAPDDSLPEFFSDVPPDKRGITVHHLLTHTAGLGEYSGRDAEVIDKVEFLRRVLVTPLQSAPGDRYRYSNPGYGLLAAIVERVTRQSYTQALQERVLSPAGMVATGYIRPDWEQRHFAHRYKGGEDTGINPQRIWGPEGPSWNLVGNGGLHSNVRDLHRWVRALDTGDLLTAEWQRAQFNGYICMGLGADGGCEDHYGYGWHIWSPPGRGRIVMHNGSDGAYFTEVRRYVDDGFVVIVSSNRSDEIAERLAPRLAAQVLRTKSHRATTQAP